MVVQMVVAKAGKKVLIEVVGLAAVMVEKLVEPLAVIRDELKVDQLVDLSVAWMAEMLVDEWVLKSVDSMVVP